jgi:hypothetical protein
VETWSRLITNFFERRGEKKKSNHWSEYRFPDYDQQSAITFPITATLYKVYLLEQIDILKVPIYSNQQTSKSYKSCL